MLHVSSYGKESPGEKEPEDMAFLQKAESILGSF